MTNVGAGSVCPDGPQTEQILSEQTVDGRDAFEDQSWCSAAGTSFISLNGDEADFDYQGSWQPMIDPPVQEGHAWTYFNTGYTWHDAGIVTVPAGTFSNCWKALQDVSYTAYIIYCRGIGAVRSYSSDLNGDGWDAQLASKNF